MADNTVHIKCLATSPAHSRCTGNVCYLTAGKHTHMAGYEHIGANLHADRFGLVLGPDTDLSSEAPTTSRAPVQELDGTAQTLGLALGVLLGLGGPIGLVPQALQLFLQSTALTLAVTELLPQRAQEVLAGLVAPTHVLWHGNH